MDSGLSHILVLLPIKCKSKHKCENKILIISLLELSIKVLIYATVEEKLSVFVLKTQALPVKGVLIPFTIH